MKNFVKIISFSALLFSVFFISAQTPLWKTLPEPPAMPKADKSGLAAVNGVKLYYAIFNQQGKEPVLLLHGGFVSSDCWGFEVPLLSKNHKVIIVDSRGHGRSTMNNAAFSYELMTSDVMQLLDYLKIRKISIVGWSDGGIIGLLMAIHHPERVNKLFTFGTNFNQEGYRSDEATDTALAAVFMKRIQSNYQRLSSTPDSFPRLRKALVKMYSTEPDIDPDKIKTIHAPTVIAGGEYDQFIKREHFEQLAHLIPGARLVIIPNVSHGGALQDPTTFHKEVTKLLDGG
jgi:pimeloyl-ACP methyl ester carboxylesterase